MLNITLKVLILLKGARKDPPSPPNTLVLIGNLSLVRAKILIFSIHVLFFPPFKSIMHTAEVGDSR